MFPRRQPQTQPHAVAPGLQMENCSVGICSVGGGTVKNCTIHIGFGSRKDKKESLGLDGIKKASNIPKAADPGHSHEQTKVFDTAEEYATFQEEALKATGLEEEEPEGADSSTPTPAEAKEGKNEDKKARVDAAETMAGNEIILVFAMFVLLLLSFFPGLFVPVHGPTGP